MLTFCAACYIIKIGDTEMATAKQKRPDTQRIGALSAIVSPLVDHESMSTIRYPDETYAVARERFDNVAAALTASLAELGYTVTDREAHKVTLWSPEMRDTVVFDGMRCKSALLDRMEADARFKRAADFKRFAGRVDR